MPRWTSSRTNATSPKYQVTGEASNRGWMSLGTFSRLREGKAKYRDSDSSSQNDGVKKSTVRRGGRRRGDERRKGDERRGGLTMQRPTCAFPARQSRAGPIS